MNNQNCDFEKCFEFDFIEGTTKVPKFSRKNIALINVFLKYNSSYSSAENEEDGSYSYILKNCKENFFDFEEINIVDKNFKTKDLDEDGKPKDTLYRVIESIDKINSTHLASEGGGSENKSNKKKNRGRVRTAQAIRKIENLQERMRRGDGLVVDEIAKAGGKYNFSFATKFCSYVSKYVFGEENNKYCIYDNVVQSVLPCYIYHYVKPDNMEDYCHKVRGSGHIKSDMGKFKDEGNYDGYREIIDKIIAGIEEIDHIRVTYEQFDHILWYYFKGSKNKVQEALDTIELK